MENEAETQEMKAGEPEASQERTETFKREKKEDKWVEMKAPKEKLGVEAANVLMQTVHPITSSSSTLNAQQRSESQPTYEFLQSRFPSSVSLVDVLCLQSSITHLIERFITFDREAFVAIHNEALKKLSRFSGILFYPKDRPEGQAIYKSLEPAHDLVPSGIDDLQIGKRNVSRVLYGEACVEPFKLENKCGRIYSVLIEAYSGKAIALSIIDPHLQYGTYPQGTKIAIKEPRLLKDVNGFIWIDVDNPSGIEKLEWYPNKPLSQIFKEKIEQCFENGNRAHKEKKWEECIRNYNKLEICIWKENHAHTARCDQIKMERALLLMHYRRCQAYIEVDRHSLALKDAESCCNLDPTNRRVIVAKIVSLISVGRHKDAYNYVQTSCNMFDYGHYEQHLDFKNGSTKQLFVDTYRQNCVHYYGLGNAIARIAENPNAYIPDDDFYGPVEIKNSACNGCGRGMFAREPIKAGTVILISKALARCDNYYHYAIHDPFANGLVNNLVKALTAGGDDTSLLFLSLDPSVENYFRQLTPKLPDFLMKPPTTKKINTVKLTRATITRITESIAFDDMSPGKIEENAKTSNYFNTVKKKRCYYGVWFIPSFMNHSCVPNASRINVSDVMSIHATKDISRGEEITIPYFNVLLPHNVRETVSKAWGFRCLCERCELERNVSVLDADLNRINEDFHSTYLESVESGTEARPSLLQDNPTGSGSAGGSGIDIDGMKLYEKVKDGLSKLINRGILTKDQHIHWIVSSFTFAHLSPLLFFPHESNKEDEEKAWIQYLVRTRNVIQVIAETCPGNVLHLLLAAWYLKYRRRFAAICQDEEDEDQYFGVHFAEDEMKKACLCVYGQQKPEVVEAILTKYMEKTIW